MKRFTREKTRKGTKIMANFNRMKLKLKLKQDLQDIQDNFLSLS
jgi:hypothetical protein